MAGKDCVNSLRLESWGTHITMTVLLPHVKLFTLIPGPWSSNKDIRWFSVAQTISNISVYRGFRYRPFL